METEDYQKQRLENLISEALKDAPPSRLSASFTDRLMKRIEHRLAAREVISEFLLKSATIIGVLALLAGLYFIPELQNSLLSLFSLAKQGQAVLFVGIAVFFTLIIDQVILRYMFKIKK